MSEPRYMSLSTLASVLDVGESTIEGWIAQGSFPVPKKIGPNGMRRWSWREVRHHMAMSIEEFEEREKQTKEYENEIINFPYPTTRASRVYFVGLKDVIKIGITDDLRSRIMSLMAETPFRIKLLHHILGDRIVEQSLHLKFAKLRVRGEWFRAEEELFKFIDTLKCAALSNVTAAAKIARDCGDLRHQSGEGRGGG